MSDESVSTEPTVDGKPLAQKVGRISVLEVMSLTIALAAAYFTWQQADIASKALVPRSHLVALSVDAVLVENHLELTVKLGNSGSSPAHNVRLSGKYFVSTGGGRVYPYELLSKLIEPEPGSKLVGPSAIIAEGIGDALTIEPNKDKCVLRKIPVGERSSTVVAMYYGRIEYRDAAGQHQSEFCRTMQVHPSHVPIPNDQMFTCGDKVEKQMVFK
jgi:hypothetical protein